MIKHKLKIYTSGFSTFRLWYVECLGCSWEVETRYRHPNGQTWWGRPNLDTALAAGIAHQKEKEHGA